jgi:hypothetical protein
MEYGNEDDDDLDELDPDDEEIEGMSDEDDGGFRFGAPPGIRGRHGRRGEAQARDILFNGGDNAAALGL